MSEWARCLVIDTSGRIGQIAIAQGERIVELRKLPEARRHARDLPVRLKEMIDAHGWQPRGVTALILSIGPGSYTGLRVGVASAQALAYATGCALFAVPAFDAMAAGIPGSDFDLAVVADAQQGSIYVGHYRWSTADGWRLTHPLFVKAAREWVAGLPAGTRVIGPGVELVRPFIGSENGMVGSQDAPDIESFLTVAQRRSDEYRANPWTVEPIYLRGSSAEEKRKRATESPA